ncbi:neuraminidase-like domain-containing protein [Sorangium sp. So ce315]|uniref:Tc toxin subunit A-related protein n=1 Tax=Sorangium sp. So ce315 TaxID=3133299 RepID=UPI003F5D608E
MSTYQLSGRVVRAKSDRGVAGVRVEGWDSAEVTTDLVAVAVTNSDGEFTISLDQATVDHHFQERQPVIALRAFTAGGLELVTRHSQWTVSRTPASIRIEVDPAVTSTKHAPASRVVRGTVRAPDGGTSSNLTVRVYDVNLSSQDELGSASTDSEGRYKIEYTSLAQSGKTYPDLRVIVYSGVQEVGRSALLARAPATAVVDVITGSSQEYRGPSELAQLWSRLSAYGVYGSPGVLQEEQIELLAQGTGAERAQIEALSATESLSSVGVAEDTSFYYPFVRKGLPTTTSEFLTYPRPELRRVLLEAIEENIISGDSSTADSIIGLISEADFGFLLDTPPPGATGNLGQLLGKALSTQSLRQEFVDAYLDHDGSPEAFWTELATRPSFQGAGVIPSTQLALQLGALTRYHFPLIDELWERKQGGQITGLKDLAAYSEADWVAIVGLPRNGSPINFPADTPGADVTEKRAAYAKVLRRAMEVAFPTKAVSSGIAAVGGSELPMFFNNNPSFELGKTRVGDYIASNPGAFTGISNPALASRELKAVERLHKLTPTYDQVKVLLDADLTSSRSIVDRGRDRIVAELGPALGGSSVAGNLYDSAAAIADRALALFLKFGAPHNPKSAYALPDLASRASQTPQAFATYADLFGSPDACACAHCASVYGPAAYLVDLLRFLDRYDSKVTKSGSAKWTAKELLIGSAPGATPALAGQRPDIGRIDLTCESADTPLPYVDLVNEILTHAVASESLEDDNQLPPAFPEHIATTGSAEELAAMPSPPAGEEAWHTTAYAELASSSFPFVTPYDPRRHEARVYLNHLGVPLHALAASLDASLVLPENADFASRAGDRLGLSPYERAVIVGNAGLGTTSAWGFTGAVSIPYMLKVTTLLARAGLSYDELRDLLDTAVLRRFGTPALSPADSCNIEEQSVAGLSSELSALGMIHRFLRLCQRLGWSIRELDQVLAACAPSGTDLVNDRALRVIAVIQALRAERGLSLPIAVLASWFGPLDTQRRDGGKTPSLYEQLFQNKAVTSPVDPGLALSTVASLSSTDLLASHTPAILSALRISQEELSLLTEDSGLDLSTAAAPVPVTSAIPALETLAKLHRIVTFARALRLSLPDFLVLHNLSSDEPFNVDSPERTLRFMDTVERVWRSGLSSADLEVAFRERVSTRARIAMTDEAINALLEQLFGSLLAQRAKNGGPDGEAEAALIEDQLGAALKLDARTTHILVTDILTTGGPETPPLGSAFSLPALPPTSPAPSLDSLGLRDAQLAAYRHLAKAAALVQQLGLSADELERMFVVDLNEDEEAAPVLDLDALPRAPIDGTGSALFGAWERLVDLVELRRHLVGSSPSLASLFVSDPATLAAATGWPEADISTMLGALGRTLSETNPARQTENLLILRHATAALRRLGVSASQAIGWITNLSADPAAAASDIVQAAKAKYSDADWARVAPPLRDVLRERLRAVMVAYLVAKRGLKDSDDLFAELLVDVETSPAVITSRLKQAIGSVQTFVQRAFLNLEASKLTLPEEAAREWAWRKSYRVWEAGRKVLLRPEGYIDPSLRDDKSPFFKDLESELRQKDITDEAAERAFERYLDRLDEVANLEIVTAFHQQEDGDDTHLPIDVLHVVGRTALEPRKYFYRTRVDGLTWTPWEPINLDIEADQVLITVEDRRPHLFWPIVEERAEPEQRLPKDTHDAGEKAKTRWFIRLAWSERRSGAWAPRRMSGGAEPSIPSTEDMIEFWLMSERQSHDSPLQITVMWRSFRYGYFMRNNCGELEGTDYRIPEKGWTRTSSLEPARPRGTAFRGQHMASVGAVDLALPITLNDAPLRLELLNSTPQYRVFFPRVITGGTKDSVADGAPFFFYKDATATFLAELVLTTHTEWQEPTVVLPGSSPFNNVGKGDPKLSVQGTLGAWAMTMPKEARFVHTHEDAKRYRFTSFYHPYVCLFRKELQRAGVDGLLKWSLNPQNPLQLRSRNSFDATYEPNPTNVLKPYPIEDVDFSFRGAYSNYNWELFFHAPLLIALRLMQSGRHAEAQRWFHYIFDPTTGDPAPAPGRFWNVRPFRENKDLAAIEDEIRTLPPSQRSEQARLLNALLTNAADEPATEDLAAQIDAWRKDPFNPHLIARMRPIAYQKAVVIKYVENLIAWGDQLFRRETIEAINEATQLYILAGNLLGRRPERIQRREAVAPRNYWELEALGLGDLSDPLVSALSRTEAESLAGGAPANPSRHGIREPAPDLRELYFCVPADETLSGLWDTVADRLFKIRHSMNIEGVARTLPLFEPPIDPMLLVQARALGVDLATVLDDASAARLPYRFHVVLAKAMDLCGAVSGLGAALLAAMEKKDGEAIARLRSGHEVELLAAVRAVKAQQVKEAQESVAALERSHEAARLRRDHYAGLPRISAAELGALALSVAGLELGLVAQGITLVASGVETVPPMTFGVAGAMGSPVTLTTIGGHASGAPIEAASQALSMVAGALREGASIAATLAGYERRAEEWALQEQLAAKEMQTLEKQIVGAKIRAAVAEVELKNHERQTEQAREVLEFLQDRKRTTEELYDWMVAELSTVHYQTYTLAYDMAKRAERALRFELGTPDGIPAMVRFGAWDNLKQGLLAGERLQHDLRRLEVAFLEQTPREAELVKHVSLAEVAPERLIELRETGSCQFELPEEVFDLDHPGHYFRRIKSVAVTIPTVTGPYAGVNCTLTLSGTKVRKSAVVDDEYAGAANFRTDLTPLTQVITTSGGVNDAGLFETNLRDERYLPFEGAGVLGVYKIDLPAANNRFDISAISDVILHIRYTARSEGNLAIAAREHYQDTPPVRRRLFSLRSELPAEWARFMAIPSTSSAAQELSIPLTPEMFPHAPATQKTVLTSVTFYARWNGEHFYGCGGALTVGVKPPGAAVESLSLPAYLGNADSNIGKSAALSAPTSPGSWDLDTWTLSASSDDVLPLAGKLKTADSRLNDTLQDIYLLCEYRVEQLPQPQPPEQP